MFDVKEGWEPLCKFLDLPVPDEPFPQVNDKEEIKSFLTKVLIFCYIAYVVRFLLVLGVCGFLVWLGRKFL